VLKAFVRWLWPRDPEATRKRREEPGVTREDVIEMIEEASKQLNYEWNEWYEKFDKLHLRLAKRAARADADNRGAGGRLPEVAGPSPSALHFRRTGSV